MRREHLERFLDKGYELGFVKDTNNPECAGWILLKKMVPNERILSILAPDEAPEYVDEQEVLRQRPYRVLVVEVKLEALKRDDYGTNEDYCLYEVHRFSTLDETEQFLQTFGHTLEDIKWRSEIDAP